MRLFFHIRASYRWTFPANDVQVRIFLLGFLLFASACRGRNASFTSDPNDRPQGDNRDRLKSELSDLDFVPPLVENEVETERFRGPFYSNSLDLISITRPQNCGNSDTCVQKIRFYRWDRTKPSFYLIDSLLIRGTISAALLPLKNDGREDLILHKRRISGRTSIQIIGAKANEPVLVERFKSDSIIPRLEPMTDGTTALIYVDSLFFLHSLGVSILVPRRFYHIAGEVFLESPSEPGWNQYISRLRDSTDLFLSLLTTELATDEHVSRELERSYVHGLLLKASLDTTWEASLFTVRKNLTQTEARLSDTSQHLLERFLALNRISPIVRIATGRTSSALLLAMEEYDDGIETGSLTKALAAMNAIYRRASFAEPLLQTARSAVRTNNFTLIEAARNLIARALTIAPQSAEGFRVRSMVETALGNPDSAHYYYSRAMAIDSTSLEAQAFRNSYPK